MTDTKVTTDAAGEPAAEPLADPLPWLLRNTLQRQARSAELSGAGGSDARGSRSESDRRNEG